MVESYELGIFNADKEKIAAANGVSTEETEWAWLWEAPIEIRLNEEEAELLRDKINMERKEEGKLSTHGPVIVKERRVSYGEWNERS